MKKLAASMLTSAALCVMAAPAFAGERAGAFSISPFVGGYTFDGAEHLETAPVFGLRLGYDLTKNWGMELVGDYLETDESRTDLSTNALSYRLDILYNLMPDGPLVPYLAIGGGGITKGHGIDGLKIKEKTTDGTANAGLGVKYFLPDSVAKYFPTDSVALRGDVRQLFIFEEHNSVMYNWEYTAGLTFLFGGKKAAAPVVQPTPAPPAPTSSLDVMPASITKGETAKLSWTSQNATACSIQPGIGSVQTSGSMSVTPTESSKYTLSCAGQGGTTTSSSASLVVALPAPPPVLDADMDGVPDTLDKCPNTPSGVKVDKDGCPLDSDRDGVADYLDKCPDTPAGVTVDKDGCPLDSDKDGVFDYLDKCPNTPAGAKVDETGCTLAAKAAIEKYCSKPATVHVEFDTNKTTIKTKYDSDLKMLGDLLKEFPKAKGEISGHTDNVGSKEFNQKLSDQRAVSVKKYLVEKYGIDEQRISTKGYGELKPIASNKNKEGRAKNRRIETNFTCE
ncbi:MAG TPA: OmpA family protein [Geobacteraceae bacterium]|nr:OmpA family protein [Geobacteraceae bacterium]